MRIDETGQQEWDSYSTLPSRAIEETRPAMMVKVQGTTAPNTPAPLGVVVFKFPPLLEGATIAAIVCETKITVCSLVEVILDLPG